MYGYRARIGLIVPSSNTVCEREVAALCPAGVAAYATRVLFEPTLDGLRAMKTHVERASLELSSEGICQIIAFCCTVGSMLGGVEAETELLHLIEKTAGTRAVTTATAVHAAFDALAVSRVAVATPYTSEINRSEKESLEHRGIQVTDIQGHHESLAPHQLRNDMIGRLTPEDAYAMARRVNGQDNQAIFISCTNFRAIEIIERLERETGKPVVSSNQATLWFALRKLRIKDRIKGFGRLLEEH
jgi:maleate isomerase